jgi:hypothetical protein
VTRAGLILSYGRFFAEFLEDLSLVRLGLLDLTTCVGLGYGLNIFNLEVFLGSVLFICLSQSEDPFFSLHSLNVYRIYLVDVSETERKSNNALRVQHSVTPSHYIEVKEY